MARRKKENQAASRVAKGAVFVIFSAFILYGVYAHAGRFFGESPAFQVAEVVLAPSIQFIESRSLERLRGQNIFAADLKAVQTRIQAEYPAVDQLRIARRFPGRIMVTARKRNPFAVVLLNQQEVAVDASGMIIGASSPSKGDLPYLTGITDISAPVQGRPLPGQRVSAGLAIIKAVHENDTLKKFPVRSIDLTHLSQIHMHLDTVEVVLERFNIDQKISALGVLMADPGVAVDQIHYVDLRFRDPVVRKK